MLQAQQVSFRYPQNNHGLSPITLEVPPGEVTLITGSSGSGKSTLARCLMGLIPHLYHGEMSGEVWLNGDRTADQPLWQLAEKAGMVFQNPATQMLAPTVEDEIIFGLENLGLEPDEISRRLEEVIDQFDLEPLRDRSPQTLSGGEQQKLALAAIVARKPPILILDEPLSMLDSTAAINLIQHLEHLAQNGKTILVFEHRKEYLEGLPGLKTVALNGIPKSSEHITGDFNFPVVTNFNLNIEEVTVQYGDHAPLKNLSLEMSGGEWVAVVGRNGVGKTTLLRVMAGLQKHAGRVVVNTPAGVQPPDLGLVFQNPDLQLFNGSVREEILYRLPNPDLDHYVALCKFLGLTPYEETPPLLLSEGEKKRLALALVLMRGPEHGVLLDEPSLGQDTRHKGFLSRMLRALTTAGQLVVMTTHDLTLASHADRLILLGPEGVIADSPTEDVFADTTAWRLAGIELPDWFLKKRFGVNACG